MCTDEGKGEKRWACRGPESREHEGPPPQGRGRERKRGSRGPHARKGAESELGARDELVHRGHPWGEAVLGSRPSGEHQLRPRRLPGSTRPLHGRGRGWCCRTGHSPPRHGRPGEHAPFPDGPHLLSPPPRADAPSARKHSRAASLDLPRPRRVSSPLSLPSLDSHLEARPLQDRLSACKLDPLTWAAKSVQRVRLTVKRPHAEQKHTPVGLSRRHAPYTRTHAPHAHRVSWRTP